MVLNWVEQFMDMDMGMVMLMDMDMGMDIMKKIKDPKIYYSESYSGLRKKELKINCFL